MAIEKNKKAPISFEINLPNAKNSKQMEKKKGLESDTYIIDDADAAIMAEFSKEKNTLKALSSINTDNYVNKQSMLNTETNTINQESQILIQEKLANDTIVDTPIVVTSDTETIKKEYTNQKQEETGINTWENMDTVSGESENSELKTTFRKDIFTTMINKSNQEKKANDGHGLHYIEGNKKSTMYGYSEKNGFYKIEDWNEFLQAGNTKFYLKPTNSFIKTTKISPDDMMVPCTITAENIEMLPYSKVSEIIPTYTQTKTLARQNPVLDSLDKINDNTKYSGIFNNIKKTLFTSFKKCQTLSLNNAIVANHAHTKKQKDNSNSHRLM